MVLNPTLPSSLNVLLALESKSMQDPDNLVAVRQRNKRHYLPPMTSELLDTPVHQHETPKKRSPHQPQIPDLPLTIPTASSSPDRKSSVHSVPGTPHKKRIPMKSNIFQYGTPTRLVNPYSDAPPIQVRARKFASPALRSRIERLNMNIVTSTTPTHSPISPTQKQISSIEARKLQLEERKSKPKPPPRSKVEIGGYTSGGFAAKLQAFQKKVAEENSPNTEEKKVGVYYHRRNPSAMRLHGRGHVQSTVNQFQDYLNVPAMTACSNSESWSTPNFAAPLPPLSPGLPKKTLKSKIRRTFSNSSSVNSFSSYNSENLASLMLSLSPEWDEDINDDVWNDTTTPVIMGFNMDIFGTASDIDDVTFDAEMLPPLPVIARTDSMRLEDQLYEDDYSAHLDCVSDLASEDDLNGIEIEGVFLQPVLLSELVLHLLPQSFLEDKEYIICGQFDFNLQPLVSTPIGSCAFYGLARDSGHWFKISRKPIETRKIDRSSKLQWDGEVRGVYSQIYGVGLLDPCCAYKRLRKTRNAIQKSLDRSRVLSPDGFKVLETVSI